jgi:hypothetical protein
MSELDRFFDLLHEQGRSIHRQGEMLATIAQDQKDTRARLFGESGQPGAIQYLHTQVSAQGKQITFWKGALAVMAFVWTAAVAVAVAVVKGHR